MGSMLKQEVKDKINKKLHPIATNITPSRELYNSLYKWIPNCFLPSQVDRIKNTFHGQYDQATELVNFMTKRTDVEFINFCKALIDVGQDPVVKEHLGECLDLLGTSYSDLLEEVRPSQADTSLGASAAPGDAHPADQPQGYDAEKMHLDVTDDHYKVQVKKSTKKFYEEKCEQAYPMNTKKKGFALVINVQRVEGQEERTGTDIDRDKIKSLLLQLDFETITVYNDKDGLTHEDILNKVKAFAMTVDKEAQRVAVFILSHGGKEDVICGTDGETVEVKKLVKAVDSERLAGIPKMVVFQTCRGVMTDNVEQNNRPPDLITCYAAKKDYVSYRHPDEGSLFIAAIVQIFEKHAHEFEIRKLMDMVQQVVKKEGEKKGKYQEPETVHNLQKKWFLFPGTSYNVLPEEVSPFQADTSRGASAAPGSAHPADPPQGQHMPTAASASATGTGLHEEGRQSGTTVSESTWRFEISNKPDHLKSGSILPYPMEIFVPTGALSEITELKVTVTQMTDNNHPSPSIPGNRQLGPIIRFEADQAHIQFVRPLLVLVRFPEEFLKHTDDYEYRVQYNSDKDIHGGTWSDITGYNEGQVCGEVIPSHQTAVLLLPHFSFFGFFQRCKMMNVELYTNHLQQQDTYNVSVTCLVYLKPLRGTDDYEVELKDIIGEYKSSQSMDVSNGDNKEPVSLTAVFYESKQWKLMYENQRTQKIPIKPLLENNFMKKQFDFEGQGQFSFSCYIEAEIPGCIGANPSVLIPLQEQDQAVKNPSAEHGNDAADDSLGSVQTVKTKPFSECISSGFRQHLNSENLECCAMGPVLNKKVKDIMKSNLLDLAADIEPTPEFYNSLHKWNPGCFSIHQVDSIKKSNPDDYSQATELVKFMLKRTDDEFIQFCKALIAVGQKGVVEKYFSECLVILGRSYKAVCEDVHPSDTQQADPTQVRTKVGERTGAGKRKTTETVHNLQKEWFLFPGYPEF